jgi:hypothetical protein
MINSGKIELLHDNHICLSKSIDGMNGSSVNVGLMGKAKSLSKGIRQTGGASMNSAKGQGFSAAANQWRAE